MHTKQVLWSIKFLNTSKHIFRALASIQRTCRSSLLQPTVSIDASIFVNQQIFRFSDSSVGLNYSKRPKHNINDIIRTSCNTLERLDWSCLVIHIALIIYISFYHGNRDTNKKLRHIKEQNQINKRRNTEQNIALIIAQSC